MVWAGIRRFLEIFVSQAGAKCMIAERKWKEVKDWFRTENNRHPQQQRARYDPVLWSQGSHTAVMEKALYMLRKYFQLN